jgi:hypothetical protein
MALRTAYSRIGNTVSTPTSFFDGRFDTPYICRNEEKTNAAKRRRPPGIEILFNGTSVNSYRMLYSQGVWTETTSIPGVLTSTVTSVVPCPEVGVVPYPYDIPDKYWANKLRNEIRDAEVNYAQAFAERKQTEKMFVDYGGRLLKAYSSLRKGNVNGVFNALLGTGNRPYKGWKRTIRDTTGVASDSWLAYQYGIRPLISDLSGSVSEYYKIRAAKPLVVKHSVSASNDERAGGTLHGSFPSSTYVTTATQHARVVSYTTFVDDASFWDVEANRLGLTNPVLLAWELIPYSFVIDWFIGVGDFLQASASFNSIGRIGISVTTTTRIESVGAVGGGTSRRTTTIKSRSFRNSLPSAVIRINANPLSVSHTTSALALIRQLFK